MTLKRIGPFNEDDAGDTLSVDFFEDDGTTEVPLTGFTPVWRAQRVGEPASATTETAMTLAGTPTNRATLTWTTALTATPGDYTAQAKATNGGVIRRSRKYIYTVEPSI